MNLKKKLIPVLIAPIFVGLTFSGHALANESDELEKLRQLVQELDQKIKILDRKGELAEEAAAAKKKETPVVKAGTGGFSFASADGKNEIKFRGIIQADHREFIDGVSDVRSRSRNRAGNIADDGFNDADSSSLLRRVRPTIEGKINDKYGFRFTPEFGGGSASVVDAYVDANLNPAFNLRAGKFKSFVGLERLQSASDIKFLERSYVTNAILPNRDLGVAVFGSLFDKKLDYAFGIVNGVADGGNITTGTSYNGEREYTARLFATPFKDDISALSSFGFGLGGTYTDFKGEQNLNWTDTTAADPSRNGLPSYVTEGQNTFFRYGNNVVADGKRLRVSPQAYYYIGPFGLIAEYARVYQDVSLTNKGDGTTTNIELPILAGTKKQLEHDAFNIGVSYLITGEDASFKGIKPKSDFDLDKGGWGAWELVARYSELNLDSNTFKNPAGNVAGENIAGGTNSAYADGTLSAKAAKTWTFGANWYLNQNAKIAVNYAQTSFDGGSISGDTASGTGANLAAGTRTIADRPDEKAVLARFQVTF